MKMSEDSDNNILPSTLCRAIVHLCVCVCVCVCVCLCVCVSCKELSNEMAFDLDIWHGGSI